jgi:cation:H+ antiporter
MIITIELVLSAAALMVAAGLFTNAVEILGERLNLAQGAVGSVLAAVGTALPETSIPLVAIIASLFTGRSTAGDIGVGAILGAPFLLATLAMFVVGVTVLSYQRRRESDDEVTVDEGTAKRDMLYFLVFFSYRRRGRRRTVSLSPKGGPCDPARRGVRALHPADHKVGRRRDRGDA